MLEALQARIKDAAASGLTLNIVGHGSKAFYGGEPVGEPLVMGELTGITSYEPSELVVTAKAGTPIAELEAALAEKGQHLPFEPPRFNARGTVGGMVASGLSGPARARMGVLGVIAEVSLKVLPLPYAEATLRFELGQAQALLQLNRWGGQPLPINASAWWDGALVLRLAGARAAVQSATLALGGELIPDDLARPFWTGLRDHADEFFLGAERAVQGGAALWRLSLPQTAPMLSHLHGEQLVEWGGAQRWITTPMAAAQVREIAASVGGHATLFRSLDKAAGAFAPLTPPLARIHRELKKSFDPQGVFNPGRLYPAL